MHKNQYWNLKKMKKNLVIEHIARFGDLKAAAIAAGVHRNTIYYWIRSEPEYARQIHQARQQYIRALLGESQQIPRDQQTGGVQHCNYPPSIGCNLRDVLQGPEPGCEPRQSASETVCPGAHE
jgi:hypothetical protein